MTLEELDILFSEPVRRAIGENLANDPVRVALDKHIPHAGLVATQVKYHGRARTKLPSWYEAGCILPPLAFEQSSSELTAAGKDYAGGLCVDLTCGLGVDSFALSKRFDRVISVERDPVLAELARRNFALLGAANISVVNQSAEDFIAGFSASNNGQKADLIYADPDRRSDSGRKLVRLEECMPDIAGMLPLLRETAARIVVKMSPLFDVDEAFRIFGEHTRVTVVSLDGECKEVVAETAPDIPHQTIAASVIGFGEIAYDRSQDGNLDDSPAAAHTPGAGEYLVVPDVALAKARIAKRYFTEAGFRIASDNAYAFGDTLPGRFPGRAYLIGEVLPYAPKKLKKRLKDNDIRRIDILKRDFPYPAADIARQLGIAEGGRDKIAFTSAGGGLWAIFVSTL